MKVFSKEKYLEVAKVFPEDIVKFAISWVDKFDGKSQKEMIQSGYKCRDNWCIEMPNFIEDTYDFFAEHSNPIATQEAIDSIPHESQNKRVLRMLRNGEEVTNLNCSVNHHILRVGARIKDLKYAGHKIKSITEHNPRDRSIHWTRYELEK